MSDARDYIATATGLGLECSGFSPSWVIVQLVIFLISTGLAVFDTYTDWEVVLNFKETGFNNPLLPPNVHWLRAWILFASIGTFLTFISFTHDGVDLLYLMYKSCQKHCCKSSSHGMYEATNPSTKIRQVEMEERFTRKEKAKKKEAAEEDEEEHEIDDPCTCCYRCGWNGTTRNETLGAITLWFQNGPMLTLAILYAFTQTTCKTPEPRDASPVYLDVGISASAALAATTWRLIRSFTRLFISVCVRMKHGKWGKRCLPHRKDSAYPPDTCAQCCIIPFYIGLVFQMTVSFLIAGVTAGIWINYAVVRQGKNFDDSLGIYRFSINPPDVLLFNISGTIIPPTGPYINFEKIPDRLLPFDQEVYCLSEFEYREDEAQIFFNAVEVQAVSEDGKFCTTDGRLHEDNFCWPYYTLMNFILYYASINPNTGALERFDAQCSAVNTQFNYFATPTVDPIINVSRNINQTGFPRNGEPLVIFYKNLNLYLEASTIFNTTNNIYRDVFTFGNATIGFVTCSVQFQYNKFDRRIEYNVRDVYNHRQSSCFCGLGLACGLLHQNLTYGYIAQGSGVVTEYTHCSMLPQEMLAPYHNIRVSVRCPC